MLAMNKSRSITSLGLPYRNILHLVFLLYSSACTSSDRIPYSPIWLFNSKIFIIQVFPLYFPVVVQLLRRAQLLAHRAPLSSNISQSLLKFMSIELVIPSKYLILCHPLLLLPLIFPSIRVLSNESVLRIRWPKYWSFSFSISPSNEYSGLISFRIDWFDLLAVQRTLRSLLQHYNLKASILWCSTFFIVQLSHSYMTTGKTIALTSSAE